jgi:hypothetical protein
MGTLTAIFAWLSDTYSSISDFATEHPKLTGGIGIGAVLDTLWAYWKRPIISVRFAKKVGSIGDVIVDHRDQHGQVIAQTTIKDCNVQLVKVTRRIAGQKPASFDKDRYGLGWANYSASEKRDIMRGQSFHIDVATLVLLPGNRSRLVFGGWGRPGMPNTLRDYLDTFPGKGTYTYDLLISADNARPRIVPVEVQF